MRINQLMHSSFFVEDMNKMMRFYVDILGLEPWMVIKNKAYINNPESSYYAQAKLNPEGICILYLKVAEGQFIELIKVNREMIPRSFWRNTLGASHIGLTVDDIYATAKELNEKGITLDSDIKIGNSHTYQMWIHDPEGNAIEIMQYTDKSFQLTGHIDK